jgi:hypothetical protein
MLLICAHPGPAITAQESGDQIETDRDETVAASLPSRSIRIGVDHAIRFAPTGDLHPHALADPRRPGSALMYVRMLDSEIPSAGGHRFCLRLGGRFGLLRFFHLDRPEHGVQLNLEGGFFGHFDIDRKYDNIGWDGIYGFTLSWRPSTAVSARIGALHDSAHVGDEYAERTGRRRVQYTREEWVAGLNVQAAPSWRTYAEAGYAYLRRNDQEPWRVQLGVEHAGRRRFWRDQLGWYAAADLTATEERDWKVTTVLQVGFELPTGRGCYRLGLEYLEGRSPLGEFFFHDESYLAFGLWFDF